MAREDGQGDATRGKYQGLQALRGIAVILVFIQHLVGAANGIAAGPVQMLYQLAPGGIGVFIFFALSAFLMVGKAGDPPARFLLDRVRRIYPAFWLALALTIPLQLWLLGNHGATWELALLLPFGDPPNVAMPYWTLFYELLFYLGVAGLALLSPRIVVPGILLWTALAFVFYTRPYQGAAQYGSPDLYDLLLPMVALYFGCGVLARLGFRPRPDGSARPAMALYAVGALAAFLGIRYVAPLYLLTDLPPVHIPDAVLLLMGAGAFCAVRAAALWPAQGLAGRALAVVGDLSYGIYLVHLVLLYVAAAIVRGLWPPDSFWAACVLLTVLVMPVCMLFGLLDARLQRRLKQLQARWAERRLTRRARVASFSVRQASGTQRT